MSIKTSFCRTQPIFMLNERNWFYGSLFKAVLNYDDYFQVIFLEGQIASFLQTRGSVPLFWEQPGIQVMCYTISDWQVSKYNMRLSFLCIYNMRKIFFIHIGNKVHVLRLFSFITQIELRLCTSSVF